MTEADLTRISKFLSLVLRHKPQTIGIHLDEQGWTNVNELFEKLATAGYAVDRALLNQVVNTSNKNRFAFSDDGSRIRASQGHSVPVDLGYEAAVPPAVLYHGTAEKNLPSILHEGLQKQSRHHVHLSAEIETARQVGRRHGKPLVLEVLAGKMHGDGCSFYRPANGVWLVAVVPPCYLCVL